MKDELRLKIPDYSIIKKKETASHEKQKGTFGSRHKAHNLPSLNGGDIVWIPNQKCTGKIVSEVAPRSYTVQTLLEILR